MRRWCEGKPQVEIVFPRLSTLFCLGKLVSLVKESFSFFLLFLFVLTEDVLGSKAKTEPKISPNKKVIHELSTTVDQDTLMYLEASPCVP